MGDIFICDYAIAAKLYIAVEAYTGDRFFAKKMGRNMTAHP